LATASEVVIKIGSSQGNNQWSLRVAAAKELYGVVAAASMQSDEYLTGFPGIVLGERHTVA
jgi:hypothetical protein